MTEIKKIILQFPLSNEMAQYDSAILFKIPFFKNLSNAKMSEVTNINEINITLHDIDYEIFKSLYFFLTLESHHQAKFLQTIPFIEFCSLIVLMSRYVMVD